MHLVLNSANDDYQLKFRKVVKAVKTFIHISKKVWVFTSLTQAIDNIP